MPSDELIPTRASLLNLLKDLGDHASWNEFYQTYRELLVSVARKAGLNDEAQEALPETLISVARKMPGFTYDPSKDSFKGWLLTVTRWRILDQVEKREGRQDLSHSAGPAATKEGETRTATIERMPDPAGFELTAIWNAEWEKNLLGAALARIKRQVHPQHYEIYLLHDVPGKPVREVARALGVNVGQVYLAKHRVGSLLKKEMKRPDQAQWRWRRDCD